MPVQLSPPPQALDLPDFDAAALEARAAALLEALGLADAELSLSLADDPTMAELNARYRGRSEPTDVLSFSLVEGEHAEHRGTLLGDVVVDLEVAARQAAELGHSLDEELLRLLIHGTLHLLGYDHQEARETQIMEARERELWARLVP